MTKIFRSCGNLNHLTKNTRGIVMDVFFLKIIIFSVFFLSHGSFAFTLLSTNPPRFEGRNISVVVVDNDCSNMGVTHQELREFVSQGLNRFWNRVPTAGVKFVLGDSIAGADDLTLAELLDLAQENQIIVGCSNSATLFSSSAILALGTMANSLAARGVVALNSTSGSQFSQLNESNKLATFAHELGHAIGIGHSEHDHALMYYAVSDSLARNALSHDDADALTYLYPADDLGLSFGACGQIATHRDDRSPPLPSIFIAVIGSSVLFAFYFGLRLFGSAYLLRRPLKKRLRRAADSAAKISGVNSIL